jgi:1,4-alpha-glucan branching enzyme
MKRKSFSYKIIALLLFLSSCSFQSSELALPGGWDYGAVYLGNVTRFVLYAPAAQEVYVSGTFNNWTKTQMYRDGDHFWVELSEALPGHEYKYRSPSFAGEWVNDPYSAALTDNSDSNSVILSNQSYSWNDSAYVRPERDQLVIYEMHVIDFTWNNRTGPAPDVQSGHQGTFRGVADRVQYLIDLGINAVELMPVQEWGGGGYSWGYNPDNYWALESSLNSSSDPAQILADFKYMVDILHQNGIAVILDVVYNHSTGDMSLYKIDSSEFYSGNTDWGPKLDLTNSFIQNYIYENLVYFMEEFHIDGFRFDSTENMDHSASIQIIDRLYKSGFDDRYYIFEEFSWMHNSGIQNYNSSKGRAVISSWGTGYKDAIYDALSDSFYGNLGAVTYHSNDYGWNIAESAISYASSHDEGTLYYHAGSDTLALAALTHKLTSLGVPMIWMGDEIMRDHRGNGSYPSGSGVDEINNKIDWNNLIAANTKELSFMQELLNLRKLHPSLRRGVSNPNTNISSFADGFMWNTNWADGFIGYVLGESGDFPFAVFVNYGNISNTYLADFPQDGEWVLIVDSFDQEADRNLGSAGAAVNVTGGTALVTIPANTAYIYVGPYVLP